MAVILSACTTSTPSEKLQSSDVASTAHLFSPRTAIQDEWNHIRLEGETEYHIVPFNGHLAIRAVGNESASVLARRVDVALADCPEIRWTWAVSKMQNSADLRDKAAEDVAASVFVVFGEPMYGLELGEIPIVRYVWTTEREPLGTVIDNPYFPGTVRSIVVRRGLDDAGQWVTETRNLADDHARAFGGKMPARVHVVALFTDNDQTKEPVEAYYGPGRALCINGSQ